jgi:hypothetical protein
MSITANPPLQRADLLRILQTAVDRNPDWVMEIIKITPFLLDLITHLPIAGWIASTMNVEEEKNLQVSEPAWRAGPLAGRDSQA